MRFIVHRVLPKPYPTLGDGVLPRLMHQRGLDIARPARTGLPARQIAHRLPRRAVRKPPAFRCVIRGGEDTRFVSAATSAASIHEVTGPSVRSASSFRRSSARLVRTSTVTAIHNDADVCPFLGRGTDDSAHLAVSINICGAVAILDTYETFGRSVPTIEGHQLISWIGVVYQTPKCTLYARSRLIIVDSRVLVSPASSAPASRLVVRGSKIVVMHIDLVATNTAERWVRSLQIDCGLISECGQGWMMQRLVRTVTSGYYGLRP